MRLIGARERPTYSLGLYIFFVGLAGVLLSAIPVARMIDFRC